MFGNSAVIERTRMSCWGKAISMPAFLKAPSIAVVQFVPNRPEMLQARNEYPQLKVQRAIAEAVKHGRRAPGVVRPWNGHELHRATTV